MAETAKLSIPFNDLVKFIEDLGLILEAKYISIPEILEMLKADFKGNVMVNDVIDAMWKLVEDQKSAHVSLGILCEKICTTFPPFCIALLKLHDNADSARLGKVLRHYAKILQRRMKEEEKKTKRERLDRSL